MSNVVYSALVSLDGFIEGPNRELDWQRIDEEFHSFANDLERGAGVHLYGRRTWEMMHAFWQTADTDTSYPDVVNEYARIWKPIPKVVFSTTLNEVKDNARLAQGSVADEIAGLKVPPGKNIQVSGAGLASSLIRLGLIDEFLLFIQPVILGGGTPMFPLFDKRTSLELLDTRQFDSGVMFLHYLRTNTGS
jgi:dihydrofolate reductase